MGLTYKQDVFSSHRNSTLTDQNIDSKSWVALIHQSLQGTLQDGFVSPKMFVSGPTKRFANLKPPIPDRPGGGCAYQSQRFAQQSPTWIISDPKSDPLFCRSFQASIISPSPYLWFFLWFVYMVSSDIILVNAISKSYASTFIIQKWSTLINPHEANILHYPLNVCEKPWEITMFHGKNSLFLWPFSIANCNSHYQRVYHIPLISH